MYALLRTSCGHVLYDEGFTENGDEVLKISFQGADDRLSGICFAKLTAVLDDACVKRKLA